jgi:hypothetical protein
VRSLDQNKIGALFGDYQATTSRVMTRASAGAGRKKYWRRSTGTRLPPPRNSAVNFGDGLKLGRQVAVDLEADADLK